MDTKFNVKLIGALNKQESINKIRTDIKDLEKDLPQIDLSKTTRNAKKPTDEFGKSIEDVGKKTKQTAQEMRFF